MRPAGYQRLWGIDDFERLRPLVRAWLMLAAMLMVAYWVVWFADRGLVASSHTVRYIAFEQAFPLGDAWLLAAILMAAVKLSRRRPSALIWLEVAGGAGVYLCALDVLYDIQHGIYSDGHGGAIELAINVLTAVSGIGVIAFGWRFRHELL
jgi:hypothetical protein